MQLTGQADPTTAILHSDNPMGTDGFEFVEYAAPDHGPGRPIADGGVGYFCLAEIRVVEQILTGSAKTPFLADGDRVTIEMRDEQGRSIFGTIDQRVVVSARAR